MSTKNEFIKHISQHDFAEVCQNTQTGQHLLRSSISFKPDAVICPFSAGETLDEPTYLTIQVADNQHITLKPEFLQFTNHSCSPNAFFNTTTMQFICLKQIVVGDEITFFYPSSEWNMTQSFACHCGTPECLHQIQGAFYLPFSDLKKYRLTDFIRLKIKQEAAAL